MMRNFIKKRGAILCAVVVIGALVCYLAAFAFAVLYDGPEDAAAIPILLVYGVLIAAMIVGILAALRLRMKEIDGGEEENAKQY